MLFCCCCCWIDLFLHGDFEAQVPLIATLSSCCVWCPHQLFRSSQFVDKSNTGLPLSLNQALLLVLLENEIWSEEEHVKCFNNALMEHSAQAYQVQNFVYSHVEMKRPMNSNEVICLCNVYKNI